MPSWQPEFRELVRQTPGPVGVGTVFRYRRKVPFGEQQGTMQITEWDPPRRLGFTVIKLAAIPALDAWLRYRAGHLFAHGPAP